MAPSCDVGAGELGKEGELAHNLNRNPGGGEAVEPVGIRLSGRICRCGLWLLVGRGWASPDGRES